MFSVLIDCLQQIINSSVCHSSDTEAYMECLFWENEARFPGPHYVELSVQLGNEDGKKVWVSGMLGQSEKPKWFNVFLRAPDCEESNISSCYLLYPYWEFSVEGEEIQLHVVTVVRKAPQCCLPGPYAFMQADEISTPGDMHPCSGCEQRSLLAEGDEAVDRLLRILEQTKPVLSPNDSHR